MKFSDPDQKKKSMVWLERALVYILDLCLWVSGFGPTTSLSPPTQYRSWWTHPLSAKNNTAFKNRRLDCNLQHNKTIQKKYCQDYAVTSPSKLHQNKDTFIFLKPSMTGPFTLSSQSRGDEHKRPCMSRVLIGCLRAAVADSCHTFWIFSERLKFNSQLLPRRLLVVPST